MLDDIISFDKYIRHITVFVDHPAAEISNHAAKIKQYAENARKVGLSSSGLLNIPPLDLENTSYSLEASSINYIHLRFIETMDENLYLWNEDLQEWVVFE
jgi:hypothetical protein